MSETTEIDLSTLFGITQRETENDTVQEVNPELYTSISEFIGKLKREEYDSTEAKIKSKLVQMVTELTTILITTRLEKALSSIPIDYSNLLDEEKYILDSEDEMRERQEMIVSATLNGKSKLLESISQKHKTKSITVRFLKEMDAIVGVDLEKYGPFKTEDVATIPYENAQALISKSIAVKIRVDD